MKFLDFLKKVNRDLFLWIYYDFANSIAFIVVSFYFPLYLLQDRGGSDYLVSFAAVGSTILLVFTLPSLGHIADACNNLIAFLKWFTLTAVAMLIMLSTLIYFKTNIYYITFCYFVFLYFYQATISFYNALLNDNSTMLRNETVSGLGLAAGQLGNAVGLGIILPIAVIIQKTFSTSLRESALLFPGIAFLFLMIPFLYFYKPKNEIRITDIKSMNFRSIMEVIKDKNAVIFLLSFFFFADAILTLQIFASVVLEKVIHLNDHDKTVLFIIGLLCGVTGGLVINRISKFVNDNRKLMILLIFAAQVIMFLLASSYSNILLRAYILIYSLIYGMLFSLSRIFYLSLIPPHRKGQYFSIYGLFERLASVLGPLVWTITLYLTSSMLEETRYRLALTSLGVLGVIGGLIFLKLKPIQKIDE